MEDTGITIKAVIMTFPTGIIWGITIVAIETKEVVRTETTMVEGIILDSMEDSLIIKTTLMVGTIPITTTIPTTMLLDFIINEDIIVVVFQHDIMLKDDITMVAFKEDTMVLVFTVLISQMVVVDITQEAIMEVTIVLLSLLIHLNSFFLHHHLHNTLFPRS